MAPKATPISTVDDIDEAVWWVLMTAPRNIDYMKIVDALLDQRLAIMQTQDPSEHPTAPTHHSADHHETPSNR